MKGERRIILAEASFGALGMMIPRGPSAAEAAFAVSFKYETADPAAAPQDDICYMNGDW
jgi:hypothetical protein